MLLILYLGVLVWQILWLISAWKQRNSWMRLVILEVLSAAAALGLMVYYDNLPGIGMMPGLTYFAEVIYSMLFTAVYTIMAVVSGICAAVRLNQK